MNKIVARITMGKDYETNLAADSVNELVEKIRDWHTMTGVEKDILVRNGKLDQELESGWWWNDQVKDTQTQ